METVTSRDGTQIAYDKYGQGPLVILVSGAMGHRQMGFFRPLAELMAGQFTVIDYDRRGRGNSTDTQPYAVDREIEDIEALVKANGGSAYLAGISSGAALAMQATAAGLAVKKLAMFEAPYTGKTINMPFPEAAQQTRELVAQGKRGDAIALFMKLVGMPALMIWIMKLMPFWSKLKAVAHTLPYDYTVMGNGLVPQPVAAKVNVPTLVMDGGKSPASLRDPSKELAQVIPGAQYRTLEGQQHNVSMKVLAPVLIEFFKE